MISETVLNFSSKGLTEVPESVLNIAQIDKENAIASLNLDFNDIVVLPLLFCEKLSLLSHLSMNGNGLTTLPSEINLMGNLAELFLKENDLCGLPDNIGKLKHLRKLHLTGNHLVELPSTFPLLQNLTELLADENEIKTLPHNFGNLNSLCHLDVSCNNISALPSDFGNLMCLNKLNLSNNVLNSLPASFQNLPSIEVMDLTANKLNELPMDFSSSIILVKLLIGQNQLTTLPSWFSSMESIEEIHLECNNLQQMPFPESFGNNCNNLEFLDLSGNSINSLPISFGNLKKLRILDLGSPEDELERNRFLANGNSLFCLPASFIHLQNLIKLELDENQIIELPTDFGCLSSITYLDLSHNALQKLPDSFCELSCMKVCMLSMNYLSVLPECFGLLTNLEDLKLDNNMLAELPSSFGNLINLQILDLYNNRLKDIPQDLSKMKCLKHLDLRENNFDLQLDEVPEISFEATYPVRKAEMCDDWRGRKRPDIQPCSWVERKVGKTETENLESDIIYNALNSSSAIWRKHGQNSNRMHSSNIEPLEKHCYTESSSESDTFVLEYLDEEKIAQDTSSYIAVSKSEEESSSSDWENEDIFETSNSFCVHKHPVENIEAKESHFFLPSDLHAPKIVSEQIWDPEEIGQFDDAEL